MFFDHSGGVKRPPQNTSNWGIWARNMTFFDQKMVIFIKKMGFYQKNDKKVNFYQKNDKKVNFLQKPHYSTFLPFWSESSKKTSILIKKWGSICGKRTYSRLKTRSAPNNSGFGPQRGSETTHIQLKKCSFWPPKRGKKWAFLVKKVAFSSIFSAFQGLTFDPCIGGTFIGAPMVIWFQNINQTECSR